MIPKWLANVIVVLVAVVWAGNFVAAVFVAGYQPDPVLNFVFLAIVGSALALKQDGTGSVMARIITAARVIVAPGGEPPPPHVDTSRKEDRP